MNAKFNTQRASALIIALIMVAVLASLGAASFIAIKDKYRVVHQAASWEEALHSAEAGVEIGLSELRRTLKGETAFVSEGWTQVGAGGSNTTKTHILRSGEGGSKSWTVVSCDVPFTSANGDPWYRIRAHGYCGVPGGRISAGSGPDLQLRKLSLRNDRYSTRLNSANDAIFAVTNDEMSDGPLAHRAVEVVVRPTSAFQMALFGKDGIDLTDHNIVVDSYDSRDRSKSYWKEGATYGDYPWVNGDQDQGVDRSKQQWHGDIGTNGEVINAGNAHIYGTASTNAGSVLNDDNVTGHFEGDPDAIRNDFSMDLAEVIAPSTREEPTSTTYESVTSIMKATEIQAGETYTTVLRLNSINLSGSDTLILKGVTGATTDVHIIVSGNISITGQAQIILEEGVRLRLFVGGDADIAGNGVSNPNRPVNFQLYGLTRNSDDSTNTGTIKIAGNGGFRGAVYAPNYDIEIKGGGNSDSVYGGFVGNNVKMTGVQSVHYDEALGDGGLIAGYKIVSWFEDER